MEKNFIITKFGRFYKFDKKDIYEKLYWLLFREHGISKSKLDELYEDAAKTFKNGLISFISKTWDYVIVVTEIDEEIFINSKLNQAQLDILQTTSCIDESINKDILSYLLNYGK